MNKSPNILQTFSKNGIETKQDRNVTQLLSSIYNYFKSPKNRQNASQNISFTISFNTLFAASHTLEEAIKKQLGGLRYE